MGKKYVILSLLKEKKIDYKYLPEKEEIRLPCPNCLSEMSMSVISTNWICDSCSEKGNLLFYIRSNVFPKVKVYNPLREKKQIITTLNRLTTDQTNSSTNKSLAKLKQKIQNLIKYYENG